MFHEYVAHRSVTIFGTVMAPQFIESFPLSVEFFHIRHITRHDIQFSLFSSFAFGNCFWVRFGHAIFHEMVLREKRLGHFCPRRTHEMLTPMFEQTQNGDFAAIGRNGDFRILNRNSADWLSPTLLFQPCV